MEKSFNILLNDFRVKIFTDIQEAGLPISAIESVLRGIYMEIDALNKQTLAKELKELEETETTNE